MKTTPQECAHEILDVVPTIIQTIRFEMRSLRLMDLTVPQFRTLAYVRRNPGASLSAAAEFIGLTLSSMSILVNGLVDRALVERVTSSQDRRRIRLTLTTEGEAMLESVLQGTEARLADMVRHLSDAERAVVLHALQLLRPIFLPGSLSPHEAQPARVLETTTGSAADGAARAQK